MSITNRLSNEEIAIIRTWSIERVINAAQSVNGLSTEHEQQAYEELDTVAPICRILWNAARDEVNGLGEPK